MIFLSYNFFKAIIDGLNKQALDEQNRQLELQQQVKLQQENIVKMNIAHLLADALNDIPDTLGFSRQIRKEAIRIISTPSGIFAEIPDTHSEHAKLNFQRHLATSLNDVLANISMISEHEFLIKLSLLSKQLYTPNIPIEYDCFFNNHNYGLISLKIHGVFWENNVLRIFFTFNLNKVWKYSPQNIGYNVNFGFYAIG